MYRLFLRLQRIFQFSQRLRGVGILQFQRRIRGDEPDLFRVLPKHSAAALPRRQMEQRSKVGTPKQNRTSCLTGAALRHPSQPEDLLLPCRSGRAKCLDQPLQGLCFQKRLIAGKKYAPC